MMARLTSEEMERCNWLVCRALRSGGRAPLVPLVPTSFNVVVVVVVVVVVEREASDALQDLGEMEGGDGVAVQLYVHKSTSW
ncbi:unnamed protein product [Lampetra planeri]